MLNSKQLIETTNISRATLNNYVALGILPSPVIRAPGDALRMLSLISAAPAPWPNPFTASHGFVATSYVRPGGLRQAGGHATVLPCGGAGGGAFHRDERS